VPIDYPEKVTGSEGISPDGWQELPRLIGGNIKSSQFNACIGRQYDDISAAHAYLAGYRQAAQLIAAYVVDNKQHQDTLVYPFVFCWRHYIELALKQISHESNPARDLHGHGMMRIWKEARPILLHTLRLSEEVTASIDDMIVAIQEIDITGQTFRYAISNKGERHLSDQTLLNISDFNIILCSIADIFDNCLYAIHNNH
jgi:hypothetical protein